MTIRLATTRSVALVVLAAAFVIGSPSLDGSIASAANARPRLSVSYRSVLPGEVITLNVQGRGTSGWFSGVASDFEGHTRSGWERLYMLQSFGGAPRVAPVGSVITLQGIPDPVLVAIPPVKPGVYRITRRYSKDDGEGGDPLVRLSAKVIVKKCPAGTAPRFIGADAASNDPAEKLGQPSCAGVGTR